MMSQPMTQQEIEYYEYEPAPSSRVSKEEMDIRRVLDDSSGTRVRLRQQPPSSPIMEVGLVVLLEERRRRYSILLFLLEIDRSSVMPYFRTESKTYLMEEAVEEAVLVDTIGVAQEDVEEENMVLRISEIVDKLIKEDELFKGVDKTKMIESLSPLIKKFHHELISVPDDKLIWRIEKVMLVEVMSGMLNDLSPAQMESFEAAVKRRKFFK